MKLRPLFFIDMEQERIKQIAEERYKMEQETFRDFFLERTNDAKIWPMLYDWSAFLYELTRPDDCWGADNQKERLERSISGIINKTKAFVGMGWASPLPDSWDRIYRLLDKAEEYQKNKMMPKYERQAEAEVEHKKELEKAIENGTYDW